MPTRVRGSVKNKVVASELQEERASGPKFDKHELTMALWKKDWVYQAAQKDLEMMEKHPILANTHKYYDWNNHQIH